MGGDGRKLSGEKQLGVRAGWELQGSGVASVCWAAWAEEQEGPSRPPSSLASASSYQLQTHPLSSHDSP